MRIGMTLPTMRPDLDRGRFLQWCRRIDDGPYSSLAAGDRITYPNEEMFTALAAAATATESVEIIATVAVLPMRQEVLVAKTAATLDVLSGGRFTLGVGTGGRDEDYRSLGAQRERPVGRMNEQVGVLRRIWAGEPPFDGAAPVGPEPVQPGGPPLLVGALGPRSVLLAAEWADGLCGFDMGPVPETVAAAFDQARTAWSDAGRGAPRLTTSFWFALGSGARDRLDAYVRSYLHIFGEEFAHAAADMCRVDSQDALAAALDDVAAAGADDCLLVPTTSDPAELDLVAEVLESRTGDSHAT